MASKTITIREDVYKKLKALKRDGESFSDEIERLTTRKENIDEFAGLWSDASERDIEGLKQGIKRRRKSSRIKSLLNDIA